MTPAEFQNTNWEDAFAVARITMYRGLPAPSSLVPTGSNAPNEVMQRLANSGEQFDAVKKEVGDIVANNPLLPGEEWDISLEKKVG